MDVTITPSALRGSVPAVPSKSVAHRLLILAALADNPHEVRIESSSADIEATRACLRALRDASDAPLLDCGESGSTLRFMLPVVGALGLSARMTRRGRLPQRPLAPFDAQLAAHGMRIEEDGSDLLASGQLRGGTFVLPGDVSSQYVSALLMAAPLLSERSEVLVGMPVQSRPYVELTMRALEQFGVTVHTSKVVREGRQYESFLVEPTPLRTPESLFVEGDWSNAAFWLAAGSLEDEGLTVTGLDLASAQGDRTVLAALAAFGARIARRGDAARATRDTPRPAQLGVSAIPDLVPPLAAVAATAPGTTRLRDAGRLRLKESDRLEAVTHAINTLGGYARVEGDDLVIEGVAALTGGVVDAANDHRIAMMAAVMATHAQGPVTVTGAECVSKSYPAFWDDYARLRREGDEPLRFSSPHVPTAS